MNNLSSVIKKELVINSLFRDNYDNTTPNNFTFFLPEYVKNVSSITLTKVSIPKLLYNVSDNLGSNSFTIYKYQLTGSISMSLKETYTIFIPNGNYTIEEITNLINFDLSVNGLTGDINAHYNTINKKFYFSFNTKGINDYIFDFTPLECDSMKCTNNNNFKLIKGALGWILGYRNTIYSTFAYNSQFLTSIESETTKYNEIALNWIRSNMITNTLSMLKYSTNNASLSLLKNVGCTINDSTSFIKSVVNLPYGNSNNDFKKLDVSGSNICSTTKYTNMKAFESESAYNLNFTKAIFIYINDFNNNHIQNILAPFNDSLLESNIIAKINIDNDDYNHMECILENSSRECCGLSNIKKLEIKLFDELGRLIDINDNNVIITLELVINN